MKKCKTYGLEVLLSEIVSEHKVVEEIEKSLDVPPLGWPPLSFFSEELIRDFNEVIEIPVVKVKSGYQCIGLFRMFRLNKAIFSNEDRIRVKVFGSRVRKEEVSRRYLNELFYLPGIFSYPRNDKNRLKNVWIEAHEKYKYLELKTKGTKSEFDQIYLK